MRLIARLYVLCRAISRRVRTILLRGAFKRHGRNFWFDPDGHYTFNTIEVGDDVIWGFGCLLIASDSGIVMGDKVMIGPHVSIIAGDHNTSEVGRFMRDVRNKRPENDRVVVIEDDVWVGARAIILKGATLRRGCIVGAGALVLDEVPPYTIVVGAPARVVKVRFDIDTILRAEEQLYPPEKRFSREYLEQQLAPYYALQK